MNATKKLMALVVAIGLLAASGCAGDQQKNENLEQQVAELTQENDRLKDELASAKSALEEKEAALATSQEKHAQASDAVSAAQAARQAAEVEVIGLRDQVVEATGQIARTIAVITVLRKAVDTLMLAIRP